MKQDSTNSIIFVSAPFTDKDPRIQSKREEIINAYVVKLLRKGYTVLSPISMYYHLTRIYNLPTDYKTWEMICKSLIKISTCIHLLKLKGWKVSEGVTGERYFANIYGKAIHEIEEDVIKTIF